jgi:hypothetical protein
MLQGHSPSYRAELQAMTERFRALPEGARRDLQRHLSGPEEAEAREELEKHRMMVLIGLVLTFLSLCLLIVCVLWHLGCIHEPAHEFVLIFYITILVVCLLTILYCYLRKELRKEIKASEARLTAKIEETQHLISHHAVAQQGSQLARDAAGVLPGGALTVDMLEDAANSKVGQEAQRSALKEGRAAYTAYQAQGMKGVEGVAHKDARSLYTEATSKKGKQYLKDLASTEGGVLYKEAQKEASTVPGGTLALDVAKEAITSQATKGAADSGMMAAAVKSFNPFSAHLPHAHLPHMVPK